MRGREDATGGWGRLPDPSPSSPLRRLAAALGRRSPRLVPILCPLLAPLLPLLLAAGPVGLLRPAPLEGQLRRDPAVPHAAGVERGELLLGAGAAAAWDGSFPLSGLRGDLIDPAVLTLSYAFAPGALLRVQGEARRILDVDDRGPSRVELDPDVEDGTTTDVGDFRVEALARLLGGARGLSGGLRLAVELPNSDERKGIGTNTTDFEARLFGSWGGAGLRATADLGIGILEAPLDRFEQNDVVVYGAEFLYRPRDGTFGLAAGVRGRESTRGIVPPGTEDEGEARAGGELHAGPWTVDAGVSVGYAGTTPDLEIRAGLARHIRP